MDPGTRLKLFSSTTKTSICIFVVLVGSLAVASTKSETNVYYSTISEQQPKCEPYPTSNRFNCWPFSSKSTYEECTNRHCCWSDTSEHDANVPQCFYPMGYQFYIVKSMKKIATSFYLTLELQDLTGWPKDILHLAIDVTMETKSRLHFKIYAPYIQRYEVPLNIVKTKQKLSLDDVDYDVDVPTHGPFYITITRRSTGQVLFNTRDAAPLVFADQYLQIGTHLNTHYIYGLGEHEDGFLLSTQWRRKAMWARDNGYVGPGMVSPNVYGTHPFYMNMESDHNAHGVFFLNSNAMEIEIQPAPALTYRTIGGVLDFYIFTGPTPDNVIQQYTELIGRPFMPPYWALGFHLSRYGYRDIQNLTRVIKRTREAGMPYDSQWTDLDATRAGLDWTYDAEGHWKGFDQLVKDLHDHGQHYNLLVDPFISINQTKAYLPYTDGLQYNVFVKNPDGVTNAIGKGWPGYCVFIDFFNPNATTYWTKSAQEYHDIIPFDSLLIDMNEPSNYGRIAPCPNNTLENPPFLPRDLISHSLKAGSLCASAIQYPSTHYNLHSLYGHSEARVTKLALDRVRGKRSIVITRSTYSGTGQFAGHWSGDITSTWAQMKNTVPGLLSFQLFGIPFWGADICGFGGNTTPKLCARWFQLGAFYPFMVNHNSYHSSEQDPAVFDLKTQDIIRTSLELRYTLLPYLYTLLYRSHVDGTPVVRPLFFQYPKSQFDITYSIDEQFLWGSGLLVTPALQEDVREGPGYLPADVWYDYYTGSSTVSPGLYTIFSMPRDRMNLHIRGGSIIPTQEPAKTTTQARKNKFGLVVGLDEHFKAHGELFWDDGESLDSISNGSFTLIQFDVSSGSLLSDVFPAGYEGEPMVLGHVTVMGLDCKPRYVSVNKKNLKFRYENQVLYLSDLSVNLYVAFEIAWEQQ